MAPENAEFPVEADAARALMRPERAEVRKFFRTAAVFLGGLLVAALGLDGLIGAYLARIHHRGGLGPEVQVAVDAADHCNEGVRAIFLGDSVSHQLFTPGTEPDGHVRFLTSNFAVAMAGQYYLAESALSRDSNLKDIYLFFHPLSWQNDLPRDLTHDYFCGHFHSAKQVAEVFAVKRDIELSAAHLGRWLLPNVMAANSLSRPAFALEPSALREGPTGEPAPDPERLLTQLSRLLGPSTPPAPAMPGGRRAIVMSPVSRYFLAKLRETCRVHGIRLHVLPCPFSAEKYRFEFVDVETVYDGPMIGDIPAGQIADSIHLRGPYVAPVRDRMIELYRLDIARLH